MSIVNRIKDLCYEKEISIASLEKYLGFGNGSIYRWDKNSPTIEKVTKVADYFNVSVDYLLNKTDSKFSDLSKGSLDNLQLNTRDKKDIAKNLIKNIFQE